MLLFASYMGVVRPCMVLAEVNWSFRSGYLSADPLGVEME